MLAACRVLPAGCVSCPARMGCAIPGAGTALPQDVAEAAGGPLHASALGVSAQGAAAAHRAVWAPQGLSTRVAWAPLYLSCPLPSLFAMALLCLEDVPRLSRGSPSLKVVLSQQCCGYPAGLHKETETACVSGAGLMLEFRVLLSSPWLSPAHQPAPGQGKDRGREHKGLSWLCAGILYSLCQASDTIPRQQVHPIHSPQLGGRGSLQPSWLWSKLIIAICWAGWSAEVGPRHRAASCHGETTSSSAHPQPVLGRGEHWAQAGYSLASFHLHPQAIGVRGWGFPLPQERALNSHE